MKYEDKNNSESFFERIIAPIILYILLLIPTWAAIGMSTMPFYTDDMKPLDLDGYFSMFLIIAINILLVVGIPYLYKKIRDKIQGIKAPKGAAIPTDETIVLNFDFAMNNRKNLIKGKPHGLRLNNPFRGVFVIGSAGSGKSESIGIPMLHQFIKQDYCGLIYDFKFPSLASKAQGFISMENKTIPHYFLDFNNPLKSHRVNPISPKYLLNVSYAREFAKALISNLDKSSIEKVDFWTRSSMDILTACIWYLKDEHPDYCDIPHVFAMVTSDATKLLNTLQRNDQTAQMTMSVYNAMEQGSSNQLSGVVGTLQSLIAQINTPELMYILGGDDFSLDINNPSHPIVLTVGSYPTLTDTFAPLCSLVITVATKLMNQPNKQRSFVLLDESPTVYIPKLEVLPNTGRSNKIATVLMVQDMAQLEHGYGKVTADVLFAACNNHFYGKVSTSKTAELLSKQFGKFDKVFNTTSRTDSGSTDSENLQQREFISPDKFIDLKIGQFVPLVVESNWNDIEKHEDYMVYDFGMSPLVNPQDLICPGQSQDRINLCYKKARNDIKIIMLTPEELAKMDEL